MRRKLTSASGMDLTIMRQRQGVVTVNDINKEPQLQDVDSPLYLNYRCSAQQVSCVSICQNHVEKACGLSSAINCGETLWGADAI